MPAAPHAASANREKGALSHLHPQHLGRTVLEALAARNGFDTADVDDVVKAARRSTSRVATSAAWLRLDAGYDVRASGMTLDRFCGSGITATNIAANAIMAGMKILSSPVAPR
ncbi:MAG: hypothetical protein R2706_05800 [Acidimicrobiales bacterium]